MKTTYREIKEQYESMRTTKAYLEEKMQEINDLIKKKQFTSLIVLGCGSSYCIGKSLARMTTMISGFPASAMAAGDVFLHAQRYKISFENALVLAVSRSGSTSEILLALDALKKQGCQFTVASLTCTEGSSLSQMADLSLELPWAYDHSVCQTRTVSSLYYTYAWILANAIHDAALLSDLDFVVSAGDAYLQKMDTILPKMAERPWSRIVVLADAELCGIAEEGALAFKEVCQLPSNYYHLLDARHGPMVLIDEETLILAALGPADSYEQDFLREMSKKTSHIIAFTDKPCVIDGVETIAFEKEIAHIAKGIPFILIAQLLSYHKAMHIGIDPDEPTGLDAWIRLK